MHRPQVMLAQARRMLQDPRVSGLATEFTGNWLVFRQFETNNSVDRGRFPAFDDALRSTHPAGKLATDDHGRTGEIKPTAGRIELLGREVAGEPPWRMTGLGVGRSFQRTNIFASLTVLENVRLAVQAVAASPRRLLRDEIRKRYPEYAGGGR